MRRRWVHSLEIGCSNENRFSEFPPGATLVVSKMKKWSLIEKKIVLLVFWIQVIVVSGLRIRDINSRQDHYSDRREGKLRKSKVEIIFSFKIHCFCVFQWTYSKWFGKWSKLNDDLTRILIKLQAHSANCTTFVLHASITLRDEFERWRRSNKILNDYMTPEVIFDTFNHFRFKLVGESKREYSDKKVKARNYIFSR